MKQLVLIILCAFIHLIPSMSQGNNLNGDELFGAMTARHIGPALMSGRIADLEGHPTNNKVIYAGTAGGGVWKSTNGGASFSSIFDGHPQSIGVVKLDPNDPDNTIWVGTGEVWTRNSTSLGDGIYKSTDGGVNWAKMGLEKSERIASIQINPGNSNEIYAGVLGALWSDSEERGVYKSFDGGASWTRILYVNPSTGCSELIMDPVDPNTLYACFWEFRRTAWSFSSGGEHSALYKTTDGGKSWTKIHKGFPAGKLGRIAVAVAPSNSSVLYAAIESEKDENKGLYKSEDAGANWIHLNKDFGLVVRPFYFSKLVVDPKDPEVIAKAGLMGSISRDGGKTFRDMGQMHSDIHDILFDLHNSDRMYVGTDGGVYRSWDGANTMEIVANLPVSQFYQVSVDNEEPYHVYGGLQDNGSWYGPSSSPGGIEARDWNVVGVGDGFRVFRHPTKKIVYAEMQGAENVWRYDINKNQTRAIQPLAAEGDPKLRFNWNAAMQLSPSTPDRIYMGSQFLHRSDDMGESWIKISPDLTTNDPSKQNQLESGGLSKDNSGAENHCTIFSIEESTLNPNVIWVGTDDGNVQVTRDAGKNWTNTVINIPGLPANTWCYHIEASKHNAASAYAVFDGHTRGDMNPYVYVTHDYGKSWKSIATSNIQGPVRSIQDDYKNSNLLFLGTEFGLYISIDSGQTWNKFVNNMPSVPVHYLELHPGTSDLVMATHGRGIIILDDISPLREINEENLSKDVHFFSSKEFMIREESGFGGTSTEREFVGPNPNRNVRIKYYLKKKHIFGKMEMEIQDMDGNKVVSLVPGKARGINIVDWNFLTRLPKLATGKSITFGGFTAPRIKAGQYKVVLTKGKDVYESILNIKSDPNSAFSSEEREEHFIITRKLFDLNEQLAYMVYEMDTYTKALNEESAGEKNEKERKALLTSLTSLKENLVVSTGDNYVGVGEPQLREKLATLYSKIASGFNPPSISEKENMALLIGQFNKAKMEFESIKTGALKKLLGSEGWPDLKSFDEFVKD